MHKHFRVVAISENLRNHGYATEQDVHTLPAGIWRKLGSLYNLAALDDNVGGLDPENGPHILTSPRKTRRV